MRDFNKDEPLRLAQLQVHYPYQFQEPKLGISLAKGWARRFSRLCQEIDDVLGEDKQGFHWIQVKEKFGSPRFYFRFGSRQADLRLDLQSPEGVYSQVLRVEGVDPEGQNDAAARLEQVRDQVRQLAFQAELDCKNVCLACGRPGKPDVGSGWVLVLCPEHIALRKQIEGDPTRELIEWESLPRGGR